MYILSLESIILLYKTYNVDYFDKFLSDKSK